ncbi:MAG: TlpA family protein disulfide reductase [Kiritimatiellae bacterium]|nr:TlpA family protein disulfide reductase [Kiritimatiellia bacterium]
MKKLTLALTTALAAMLAAGAALGADEAFTAQYNAVLSRLQAMGSGVYTEAEWSAIAQSVQDLTATAKRSGDTEAIIKASVIEASVAGDMRHQYPAALKLLRNARADLAAAAPNADLSPLYVKEAELLAETGDRDAIQSLIADYKASSSYRPEMYAWHGGQGPGDPLYIARPKAHGKASMPLSIMEMALRRAGSAPGTQFPDFALTDLYGRPLVAAAYRGRVVLVDFFVRGWKRWEDNLPAQIDLFQRCHGQGFEIIGVCLERDATGLDELHLPWPVVAAAPELTKQLSIFGQSTSYLLDVNGAVLARDLRGQDLSSAVRTALEAVGQAK